MSVYMMAEIEIQNSEVYSEYVDGVSEIIRKYGGRYLVRGGRVTPLSGSWNPERVIVIEFGTAEQLRECFASPEYLKLAPLRERSTTSRAIVIDGVQVHEGKDIR